MVGTKRPNHQPAMESASIKRSKKVSIGVGMKAQNAKETTSSTQKHSKTKRPKEKKLVMSDHDAMDTEADEWAGFDSENETGGVSLGNADAMDMDGDTSLPAEQAHKKGRENGTKKQRSSNGSLAKEAANQPSAAAATKSNAQIFPSSKDAHAARKQLAKERKLAKPEGETIIALNKLWEKLRMKSLPAAERKQVLTEFFELVDGRIADLAFKHDAARVIQSAVKYGNKEQRKRIADELKGRYRALAESKYGKHMIAKLLSEGYVQSVMYNH
jgi:pumilio homology domain family member 6